MDVDEAIVQLGEKLDQWIDTNVISFDSLESVAQLKALRRGYEIIKELDQLKARGLATIRRVLDRQEAATNDQRTASLLQAFAFGAKLKATLSDELLDTDGHNKVVSLMNEIANSLDALGSGRAALAVLLDDPDPRVQASAGAYLLIKDLMPNRVLPVLRKVHKENRGRSAGFTAMWTVDEWELKQKARSD